MPLVHYAFREDAKTISLLTHGCTAACPMGQIVVLRKREITPEFLDQWMALDIRGSQFPATALTDFGRSILPDERYRYCYAIIDSQIEFSVNPRTIRKLGEFIPAYSTSGLYSYFEGQPTGFLVVLRVYVSEHSVSEKLMNKGRKGSAAIIALYDEFEEKTCENIPKGLQPVIEQGNFEYIKDEILHVLRVEGALIGVYGRDRASKLLLQQKRNAYNQGLGLYKHTYDENANIDRAIIDYEEVYKEILRIEPNLQSFIDGIRNIKPPQMVEWQTLFPRIRGGDLQAKQRVTEMYLRNVIRIALQYSKKYDVPIEEAIQEGIFGLISAIDKFDYESGKPFQTYYLIRVRQTMQRAFVQHMYSRGFPNNMHDVIEKINRTCEKHGVFLSDEVIRITDAIVDEICVETELSRKRVLALLEYMTTAISLDEYVEKCEEIERLDETLIMCEKDALKEVEIHALSKALRDALDSLTEREARVLCMRHGLWNGRDMSLEEIGKEFDITRERVRQIEEKALRKISHPSRSKRLKSFLD